MKKICHIALMHGGGGVDVYLRSLFKYSPDSVENELICSSDFGNGNIPTDCNVHMLDIPREIAISEDIKAIKSIRKTVKQSKPDVVYCHSSMAGAIGRIAVMGCKTKVIYNPHGWSFDMMDKSSKVRVIYRIIEKMLSCLTDEIVCISDYEKQIALRYHIGNKKKNRVIHNGIDLSPYSMNGDYSEHKDYVIGCAARMSAQKDPLFFASVMGAVAQKEPKARFVWIGDGELRDNFENALKENGVFDQTTITGWLENPSAEIKNLDIGVLFSRWEGFGLSLVEYLAAGKPVVARRVGGVGEIITPDVGKAFYSDSPEDYANAILSFCDKKILHEMADQCRDRASFFDIKTVVDKTWQLINGKIEDDKTQEKITVNA